MPTVVWTDPVSETIRINIIEERRLGCSAKNEDTS